MLIARPDKVFLLGREFVERLVDGEIEQVGAVHQLVPPRTQFLAFPAGDGFVVHRLRLIGHHQIGVYADDIPKAVARGACAHGPIEVK